MDPRFHPAIAAVKAGDLEALRVLVRDDPSLPTDRSSTSHPTLLQCVVLDGKDVPHCTEMVQLLIDAGAPVDEPLIAAASIDNIDAIPALLKAGAAINGNGRWSPLEEALTFGAHRAVELLLERGASIHNLRIAAGVGRVDLIEGFFDAEGSLKPEAGKLAWPFRDPEGGWSQNPKDIIDNAFVYSCMSGRIDAAECMLKHGARINTIPPGFDYAGTGLHYAAFTGRRPLVEYLLAQGADPLIKDKKVNGTAAGWADHAGFAEIKDLLERAEIKESSASE
jgi:ankyrin repeat protein